MVARKASHATELLILRWNPKPLNFNLTTKLENNLKAQILHFARIRACSTHSHIPMVQQ